MGQLDPISYEPRTRNESKSSSLVFISRHNMLVFLHKSTVITPNVLVTLQVFSISKEISKSHIYIYMCLYICKYIYIRNMSSDLKLWRHWTINYELSHLSLWQK